MDSQLGNTLGKEERLSGKRAIGTLMSDGRWGSLPHIRYCYVHSGEAGCNRIMVSVPKKYFKRAVKRNLLKRRLREAYRTQKSLLHGTGTDMMLLYSCNEVIDSAAIRQEVAQALTHVNGKIAAK